MGKEPLYHAGTATLLELGGKLSAFLLASGKRATEVCAEAGVDDASFSQWKQGKAEASWRAATSVALVLGKTPNDLMLADASSAGDKPRTPEDQAARARIMNVLDRLEASEVSCSGIVARFLEELAAEVLEDAGVPPGTVIHQPVEGTKLYEAPKVVEKMKRRRGGASNAGEGKPKYGRRGKK